MKDNSRFGDESRAFHAVLMSYDITDLPAMFERLDKWQEWERAVQIQVEFPDALDLIDDRRWWTLLKEGHAILRAQAQAVAAAVAASRRTMRIADHVVPVANVPSSMASEAGHLLHEDFEKIRVYIGLAAKYVAENRAHGCHYAEGTCDECRDIAANIVAALFKTEASFDPSALCFECGAPLGEHVLGGPYHPRPVMLPKPSAEAVKLVHKIRTYGHKTEFSITDIEAARAIDNFNK